MSKKMYCTKCNSTYTDEPYCLVCGKKLIDANNIPKCPTCQSTDIKKISSAKRVTHGLTFGLLSKTAFSQFECKNCGYKW